MWRSTLTPKASTLWRWHHQDARVSDRQFFVFFAWKVFQKIVGIQNETNCTTLLADIFLYSYEAESLQSLLSTGRKKFASRFKFTYRYIDCVLSTEFDNYLVHMYPVELEIKDTTESNMSACYLDLLLSIGRDGQLHTSTYDIRDDSNFHITFFFRAWVAIFHLLPPMTSFSRSLYYMPGLVPRMYV